MKQERTLQNRTCAINSIALLTMGRHRPLKFNLLYIKILTNLASRVTSDTSTGRSYVPKSRSSTRNQTLHPEMPSSNSSKLSEWLTFSSSQESQTRCSRFLANVIDRVVDHSGNSPKILRYSLLITNEPSPTNPSLSGLDTFRRMTMQRLFRSLSQFWEPFADISDGFDPSGMGTNYWGTVHIRPVSLASSESRGNQYTK